MGIKINSNFDKRTSKGGDFFVSSNELAPKGPHCAGGRVVFI